LFYDKSGSSFLYFQGFVVGVICFKLNWYPDGGHRLDSQSTHHLGTFLLQEMEVMNVFRK
ncbi:MAG: hypothetical protein Q4C02_09250, partial [Eubacteriales bacterium]|nr:hypothetical protein [Eubacteriales bacterium]